MNRFNPRTAAALLLAFALPLGAWAQAGNTDLSDGEVRKIDKEAGKLTLGHGEIKNLDMPGMTMVSALKDTTLRDKIQPGDRIRFTAVDDGGKRTVTQIEAAT